MGAILNTLPLNELDNLKTKLPDHADWLTSHADETGLAVVAVERLWTRFRQLNGANDATKLQLSGNTLPNDLSNDIFVRNFLSHFPRSKADGDAVPFAYFITAMRWLDGADIDSKLTAVYLYLNNGEPIDAEMIGVLLRFLYGDAKESEIPSLSAKCMRQLGAHDQGQLNQEQFIAGVKQLIPREELEEILNFRIIPSEIIQEANSLPSLQESTANLQSLNGFDIYDPVTADELKKIANQASRRNWPKLANALGFVDYEVERYRVQNNYDSTATIYELLQIWRERKGTSATKNKLKQCLHQSGLNELIATLD